jgi:hypothetical protein
LGATLTLLLRLILALGLAFSPLAQPLALAALAAPQPAQAEGGCHQHSQAGDTDAGDASPGECCYQKGTVCHCAMALTLPAMSLPSAAPPVSDHPLSVPRLGASILPAPEPPPPRS